MPCYSQRGCSTKTGPLSQRDTAPHLTKTTVRDRLALSLYLRCSACVRRVADVHCGLASVHRTLAHRGRGHGHHKGPERDAFYLDEQRLKSAVAAYSPPTRTRLCAQSTPWVTFTSYGWEQVSRTVYARRVAHVLDSETVLVANQTYENTNPEPIAASARISVIVGDTVIHAWSSKRFFDVRREIQYRLRLEGENPAHPAGLHTCFNETEARVERVEVEASFSTSWSAPGGRGIVTQPGATACARVASTARRKRPGVSILQPNIKTITLGIPIDKHERNGMNNLFEGTELLEVCFYSDFKVTAIDATSGTVLVDD
ncbi:hypothetical protein EVAR_102487_1 [Eumeta japonica]|uniref:Uncharacterized protein n=1 Tax=Eumeta variegata TaxID=151549 RepID=A0A4C1T6T3_EUMVA|nr:hypothetical protein EVAR_102487_1 [Eumeta japonica]